MNNDRNLCVNPENQGEKRLIDPYWADKQIAKACVYWPIAMCGTAVSFMADLIAGIVESCLVVYQGGSTQHIQSILLKKIIASPLQHLIFLGTNLSFPTIASAIALIHALPRNPYLMRRIICLTATKGDYLLYIGLPTIIFGPLLSLYAYHLAQMAVGQLPAWARPDRFTIFIEGGAKDPLGKQLTDEDYLEKAFQDTRTQTSSTDEQTLHDSFETVEGWKNHIDQNKTSLNTNTSDSNKSPDPKAFKIFRDQLLKNDSFINLLELKANYTATDIKKAYTKWALILHPDRNSNSHSSTILFKALCEARHQLEKSLRRTNRTS
jgi:hypothetical protein